MRPTDRNLLGYLALLFLGAAGLAVTGAKPAGAPSFSSAAALPALDGSWSGAWIDTVFFVTGPMVWDVSVNGSTFSATGTCDLTGVNLGAAEPFTASGTITGNMLTFTFQFDAGAGLTSTGTGSVNDVGPNNTSGAGFVGAPLGFGSYIFTMTATDNVMSGSFSYGGGGAGTITMAKGTPVEATSWSDIKAAYRRPGD
ncbi:MAG: hypothetical protein ACT4PE_15135 [Candidatus Eiseniibacteriota bacterium]